jgi:hypothetical protein
MEGALGNIDHWQKAFNSVGWFIPPYIVRRNPLSTGRGSVSTAVEYHFVLAAPPIMR